MTPITFDKFAPFLPCNFVNASSFSSMYVYEFVMKAVQLQLVNESVGDGSGDGGVGTTYCRSRPPGVPLPPQTFPVPSHFFATFLLCLTSS